MAEALDGAAQQVVLRDRRLQESGIEVSIWKAHGNASVVICRASKNADSDGADATAITEPMI